MGQNKTGADGRYYLGIIPTEFRTFVALFIGVAQDQMHRRSNLYNAEDWMAPNPFLDEIQLMKSVYSLWMTEILKLKK